MHETVYIPVNHTPEVGEETLNKAHAADTREKVAGMNRKDRRALAKKIGPARADAKRAAREQFEEARAARRAFNARTS